MTPRELILLSPYRLPAQNSLMLGNDDVAAFLNGYTALWHPLALRGATAPPRIGSPYDYEQPSAGHLYALPESPPSMLPDDWEQRVRDAGAASFQATADRSTTLANLRESVAKWDQAGPSLPDDPAPALTVEQAASLSSERVAAFFGIGFGYLHIEGLFEAREHENLLASTEL